MSSQRYADAVQVVLVPPKADEWQRRFKKQQARIIQLCPHADVQHIGSTAIPGLSAKDVVDIMLGSHADHFPATLGALTQAGYTLEGQRVGHAWLCWPSPEQRQVVVHVVVTGGEIWHKRLLFRDYLRANPAVTREYEQLKHTLALETQDWGEYTQRKASFVARVVELAQTPSI